MQYVFIINPAAGKTDAGKTLVPQIEAAARALGVTPVIERTAHPGHAREIAARWVAGAEPANLYACGGDGTLNEVLQAVAGCAHLALGCVPCGSGNDYVRNFGTAEDFLDMRAQLLARPVRVDLLKTGYGLGIDICAAGLDARIAYTIPRYRRLPGCGGTMSYTLSIVENLFRRIGHELRITLEGQDGHTETGSYTLLAVCNGQLYGGGYLAAPQARMDDGVLDVLLVPRIHRPDLLRIIGGYKKGEHMAPDGTVRPTYQKFIRAYRAKKVRIEVLDDRPLIVTLDGECTPCTDALEIELLPASLNALLPPALHDRLSALPALRR